VDLIMSSFSGKIARVANTRIFARATPEGKQLLVYQMDYDADTDVALILPLPTTPDAADAVRFIDLSGYPEFFADVEKGFPFTRGGVPETGAPRRRAQAVNIDGSFAANQQALADLDASNRVSVDVWKELPEYADFGFAIFKISADAHTIPPLALEFTMRTPNLLYFPTVHIHDGTVPQEAPFDHDLFCQARAGWLRSYDVAGSFMDMERAQDVVDGGERVSRMTVQGLHPNSDIIVGLKP
jgi:hypothetical protein